MTASMLGPRQPQRAACYSFVGPVDAETLGGRGYRHRALEDSACNSVSRFDSVSPLLTPICRGDRVCRSRCSGTFRLLRWHAVSLSLWAGADAGGRAPLVECHHALRVGEPASPGARRTATPIHLLSTSHPIDRIERSAVRGRSLGQAAPVTADRQRLGAVLIDRLKWGEASGAGAFDWNAQAW